MFPSNLIDNHSTFLFACQFTPLSWQNKSLIRSNLISLHSFVLLIFSLLQGSIMHYQMYPYPNTFQDFAEKLKCCEQRLKEIQMNSIKKRGGSIFIIIFHYQRIATKNAKHCRRMHLDVKESKSEPNTPVIRVIKLMETYLN